MSGRSRHDSRGDHDDTAPRALDRRLLAPQDAARYLGLSGRFAVYRLVASGRLPAVRLGSRLRLDVYDLDRMIEEAKEEPPPTHNSLR